ncbi:MAG: SWIM zinc finger family protein [Candidatus Omnitrophica bacterium]|nr:SWIM zinc finger family protein [Candidatus Omnitrophota bacterium]
MILPTNKYSSWSPSRGFLLRLFFSRCTCLKKKPCWHYHQQG